jgi:hypothetical protein
VLGSERLRRAHKVTARFRFALNAFRCAENFHPLRPLCVARTLALLLSGFAVHPVSDPEYLPCQT